MSYHPDKQKLTDTHTHTDTGDDNTRRPKGHWVKNWDESRECGSCRDGRYPRVESSLTITWTARPNPPPPFPLLPENWSQPRSNSEQNMLMKPLNSIIPHANKHYKSCHLRHNYIKQHYKQITKPATYGTLISNRTVKALLLTIPQRWYQHINVNHLDLPSHYTQG